MASRSVQGNRQQRLSSVCAILIVVAATFVKVFPFSGHLLGAGVALAIARLQQQNRIAGWFGKLPFRTVCSVRPPVQLRYSSRMPLCFDGCRRQDCLVWIFHAFMACVAMRKRPPCGSLAFG